MIIWRLANFVYMLVEGDCTVNENTKTLDTVRCRCGPFQYRVCRSAAQPADVRSCQVQLLQSFRDSGTVRYNPASGEVLGCTVLKLASFHLSVPRTTVCHQLTVHGQSRMNWLRWQQVICTRWITAAQEQSIGEFRICSQLWATVPVQHARTVFCQQRMMKSSSLLVEIYQRNSGEGRARCWCQ